MNIYNIDEVNELIMKIFNTYNGRVNTFNIAKLNIDWTIQYGASDGGKFRNPNIVTIFPKVLSRYFKDENTYKFNCAICIIHELYHADQIIDFIRLREDKKYENLIESQVEIESLLYVSHHRTEIANIIDRESYSDNLYYPTIQNIYETNRLYERANYMTHMISMLQEITRSSDNKVIDYFLDVYMQPQSIIILDIDDMPYVMKNTNWYIPIMDINNILEDKYFRHNLRNAYVEIHPTHEPNTHVLKIYTACKDRMYKLIKR